MNDVAPDRKRPLWVRLAIWETSRPWKFHVLRCRLTPAVGFLVFLTSAGGMYWQYPEFRNHADPRFWIALGVLAGFLAFMMLMSAGFGIWIYKAIRWMDRHRCWLADEMNLYESGPD